MRYNNIHYKSIFCSGKEGVPVLKYKKKAVASVNN